MESHPDPGNVMSQDTPLAHFFRSVDGSLLPDVVATNRLMLRRLLAMLIVSLGIPYTLRAPQAMLQLGGHVKSACALTI